MKNRKRSRIKRWMSCLLMILMMLPSTGRIVSAATDPPPQFSVSSLQIQKITDGAGYLDTDDAPGNDSSYSNGIVRSFDQIVYDLQYTTDLIDQKQVIDEGDVYLSFQMNNDYQTARFDLDGMKWMQNVKYELTFADGSTKLSNEYVQDDAKRKVTKQVLTGKYHMKNTTDFNAIPGMNTIAAVVKTTAAKNGEIIQPSFRVRSAIDAGQSKTAKPVRTSARLMFNTRLDAVPYVSGRGLLNYDKDTNRAFPEGSPNGVPSQMFTSNLVAELLNPIPEKQMKGMLIPTDPIRITYRNSIAQNSQPVQGEFHVYNVGFNTSDKENISFLKQNNDRFKDVDGWGVNNSPFTRNIIGSDYRFFDLDFKVPYNAGRLALEEHGETNTIVINGYDYDKVNYTQADYTLGNNTYRLPKNHFVLSSAAVMDIASFPHFREADINQIFSKEIIDVRVGDQTIAPNDQVDRTDDAKSVNDPCYPGDNFVTNIYSFDNIGAGSPYWGQDNYVVGKNSFGYAFDVYVRPMAIRSVNRLFKFEGDKLDLNMAALRHGYMNWQYFDEHARYYFAAKPDGQPWVNDVEMAEATEENLIYYRTLEELESDGKTLVGLLEEDRGPEISASTNGNLMQTWIEFTPKKALPNKYVLGFHEEARLFKTEDAPSWMTQPYNGSTKAFGWGRPIDVQVQQNDWINGEAWSGAFQRGIDLREYTPSYRKIRWNENGTYTGGDGGTNYGMSRTVIQNAASVISNVDRENYNVTQNERELTLTIHPNLVCDEITRQNVRDDVTLEVYLPEKIAYIPKSASGYLSAIEPATFQDKRYTRLTFLMPGYKGTESKEITLNAYIGEIGGKEDVRNNDHFQIITRVWSKNQPVINDSIISASNIQYSNPEFSVTKFASLAVGKYVSDEKVEAGGAFSYKLNVGNDSETDSEALRFADVLPYSGDPNGSSFHGSYLIQKAVLHFENAKESIGSGVELWGSTDTGVRSRAPELLASGHDGYSRIHLQQNGDRLETGEINQPLTALFVSIGNLKSRNFMSMEIFVKPSGNQGGDLYRNTFLQYAKGQVRYVKSNFVQTTVVDRAITGKVFLDADRNGFISKGDSFRSGKVLLYRQETAKEGDTPITTSTGQMLYPAYDVYGNRITDTTIGADGSYAFHTLQSGNYTVVYVPDGADYQVTKKDGGSDDTLDNEATAAQLSGKNIAIISNINLPSLSETRTATYVSEYNHLGVYQEVFQIDFVKKDAKTKKALSGAAFAIYQTDANGNKAALVSNLLSKTDGTFGIKLQRGMYWIEETKSPDGYTTPNGHWILTVSDNGNVTTKASSGTMPYMGKVGTESVITVYNTPVFYMPSTGAGIPWYLAIGGICAGIGFGILLFAMKKKYGISKLK